MTVQRAEIDDLFEGPKEHVTVWGVDVRLHPWPEEKVLRFNADGTIDAVDDPGDDDAD